MARVTGQDIPPELKDGYEAALNTEPWIFEDDRVRIRHPFRIPTLQGCRTIRPPIYQGAQVTAAMCRHRRVFGDAVRCYNHQPYTGGATPPDEGPRNRSWWFDEAIGKLPWYFNYCMQQSLNGFLTEIPPVWCKVPGGPDAHVWDADPNTNYSNQNYNESGDWIGWKKVIFLKPPDDTWWGACYMKVYEYWMSNGHVPYRFAVFDVEEPWDASTITWNNKPLKGSFLGYVLTTFEVSNWVRFPAGRKYGIQIWKLDPDSIGFFYSNNWADSTERPFWV